MSWINKILGPFWYHKSTPTVPLTDVQKARFAEVAKDLQDKRLQAYIEANFGIQSLDLLKAVVPFLAGLV